MSLLGFICLTMSIKHTVLLWIAWPLISSGGLASHMTNMPMARSIPLLTSAFQALTSGFMTGGVGVPLIWKRMHATLNYESIFIIWLALGSIVAIAKVILFSPKRLQENITVKGSKRVEFTFKGLVLKKLRDPLLVDEPYSLFENSQPLQCCFKKTENSIDYDTGIDGGPKANPLLLFRDIKFYFIIIAHTAFNLRLGNV